MLKYTLMKSFFHGIAGLYDGSLAAMPGARWIDERGAGATVVMRTREVTEMLAATVAGIGLAVLPCMIAGGKPALRRLTPDVLGSRTVSLVYRREALRSEPVRAVSRFVIRVMRQHADLISGVPATAV